MLKNINILFLTLGVLLFLGSCEQAKEDFNQLNRDNKPAIPVTFPNMTSFGFNPFLEVSRASTPSAAPFSIQISIPGNSGRTIKNVFIRGGNTALNASSVTGTVTYYAPVSPLQGLNSNQVTFNSNLQEFVTLAGQGTTVNGAIPATPGFNEVAFIFRLILDDDSEIITVQVRLRIKA